MAASSVTTTRGHGAKQLEDSATSIHLETDPPTRTCPVTRSSTAREEESEHEHAVTEKMRGDGCDQFSVLLHVGI